MPDRPWKAEERQAAALLGGARFKANTGGALDFESDGYVGQMKHETNAYVGQVKHVRRLSLATLEALALEVKRIVVVKRRAGKGQTTPRLVVLTEAAWRELNGGPAGPPSPELPGAEAAG